jgi:hypothetical protein
MPRCLWNLTDVIDFIILCNLGFWVSLCPKRYVQELRDPSTCIDKSERQIVSPTVGISNGNRFRIINDALLFRRVDSGRVYDAERTELYHHCIERPIVPRTRVSVWGQ